MCVGVWPPVARLASAKIRDRLAFLPTSRLFLFLLFFYTPSSFPPFFFPPFNPTPPTKERECLRPFDYNPLLYISPSSASVPHLTYSLLFTNFLFKKEIKKETHLQFLKNQKSRAHFQKKIFSPADYHYESNTHTPNRKKKKSTWRRLTLGQTRCISPYQKKKKKKKKTIPDPC